MSFTCNKLKPSRLKKLLKLAINCENAQTTENETGTSSLKPIKSLNNTVVHVREYGSISPLATEIEDRVEVWDDDGNEQSLLEMHKKTSNGMNMEEYGGLSPLPLGAQNICEEIPDVYNNVFNDYCNEQLAPNQSEKSSTSMGTCCVSVIAETNIHLPELDIVAHNNTHPITSVTDSVANNSYEKPSSDLLQTPYLSESTCCVAQTSLVIKTNVHTPQNHFATQNDIPATPATDNGSLRPFDLEVPSSYENSPAIQVDEFDKLNPSTPMNGELTIPTPMPSPLNTHSECQDAFCANHNQCTITVTASVTNTVLNSDYDLEGKSSVHTSRKRSANRKEWSDVKRKCLKNLGKKYVSKRGKHVDEKTMKEACKCRFKCNAKISEEQRLDCFKKFWQLGERQKHWGYVVKYTKKDKKKRSLNTDVPNNRKYTYKYFLPITLGTEVGQNSVVDVCKIMFLNTLSVSDRIVKTAWVKYDGSTIIEPDNRGRHDNHKNVLTDDMIKSVCDHVNSFVPVESHYVRKDSTKLYLDGILSIARLFQIYDTEWFDSSKYTCKAETERQYRDIVNTNFNLSFHKPKKDQCDDCHIFKNIGHPSDDQLKKHEIHLRDKTFARALKKNDKREARKSKGSIVAAVFDFEKVLTCPHGDISTFYNKRTLSCFNFTVYDLGQKKAVCYFWDETEAKRGANDVSSCLLDYIERSVKEGAKEFRFWSDNCTGQNRNRIVFSLYLYAAKKYNVTITHRFLVKGHTQNEGDSVHATIERGAARKIIYTPEQWRLHASWVKIDGNPYTVRKMTRKDFLDFKSHVSDRVWNKNVKGEKVTWTNIKEVCVISDEPNKLLYKTDLQLGYETITIRINTRNAALYCLELAYPPAIKLSKDKYKDLKSLCDSGVIDDEYKIFFELLPHE